MINQKPKTLEAVEKERERERVSLYATWKMSTLLYINV